MSVVEQFPVETIRPFIKLRLYQLEQQGYSAHTYTRPQNLHPIYRDGYSPTPTLSPIQILAQQCGLTERSMYRILYENKWVKIQIADKLAIGLGFHIGEIWPEYFDE